MTAVLQPSAISIQDYLAGEETSEAKHEYLGGTVHAMAGGSNLHNAISFNALLALGKRLDGKPCRPFTSDTKVRIELPDHTRFYYPDAQVVCQPNSGIDHYQERPVVVIEVLSDSTRRLDLGEKRDAYLTVSSLKVLILAEAERPYVLAYRRRAEGGFAIEEYAGLEAIIGLPEIDASLPLRELYERIEFPAA
jgi:Uma2 family endonuclease